MEKINNVDAKDLKRRLIKSAFLMLILFATVAITFFTLPESFLTEVEEANGKLWSIIGSPRNLSVQKKSPKGKTPRVNGDLGLTKPVNLKTYKVQFESGDQKFALPMSAFYAQPKVGYSTDFRCIEGWAEEVQYGGARFSDFIEAYQLGRKSDGSYYRYVGLETPDKEYYVSIDIESMLHPQTVLAYEMNEQPLSNENGAPIRLIIPIKYGIKSIKRIGRIYFSDTRPPDYWAEDGYDWWSGH